jgi:antitoxin (DNA-binding transcriptional repressor) of toxin-antitoxin stability system
MIGAAAFKARCLRIMEEASRSGETVVITKRGKPFMELKRVEPEERKPLFGMLKSDKYRFDDPDSPAYDKPWNAELGILGDED